MVDVVRDQKERGRRRWPIVAGAVGLAVLVGGGAYTYLNDEPETTFCYATGFILPNGEIADRGANCRLLDEDGNLLTTFNDGTPVCYSVEDGTAVAYDAVACEDPSAAERADGSPL